MLGTINSWRPALEQVTAAALGNGRHNVTAFARMARIA